MAYLHLMADEALITIQNVTKTYRRKQVLHGITLDIYRGEMFGLAGENGAGKSTLLSIVATVTRPTEGDIRIGGKSVHTHAVGIKKMIGYVPQEIALYTSLSGIDNLKFWGRIYGLRGKELDLRIDEAPEIIDLKDRMKDRVDTYSGGMKRRLNLGVTLLHHPEILILDEPTAGVDTRSRTCIIRALKEMSGRGCTVLYTSHHMDEIEACDRIAVLQAGKVAAEGSAEEIGTYLEGGQ